MKLTPDYDAALICVEREIEVYFAEIPDMEIAKILIDLPKQNRNISLLETWHDDKHLHQRLFYWLDLIPVFDVENTARTIADWLCKDHGLKVRLVFNRQPEKLITIRNFPDENSDGNTSVHSQG